MIDPTTPLALVGTMENHGAKHGLIPQPHGGALRNGGPNKGGTGRPKDEFLQWCAEAVSSPKVRQRIVETLETADPFPETLWERVANRGFGKPKESVELEAKLLIIDDF